MSVTPHPGSQPQPAVPPAGRVIRAEVGPNYGTYGNHGLSPYGQVGGQGLGSPPGFDLWGAMLRRKFVVLLLGLIGAAGGYLYYTKTPEVYRSALKLQITSQAPPRIVEGETVMVQNSNGRHQNLLTSQLVLRNAVDQFRESRKANGQPVEVNGLMADPASALGQLMGRFRVQPVDKSDETLILSLTGPNAQELPEILNEVVKAFTAVISEDNKAVGEEAISLIEKLLQQSMKEKEDAEEKYLTLIKQVGVEPTGSEKDVVNPHAANLSALMIDQKTTQEELRNVMDRLAMGAQALEAKDETLRRVLAIEARKHLGMNQEDRSVNSMEERKNDALLVELEKIQGRIEELREKSNLLILERDRMKTTSGHGAGHPVIRSYDDQIGYFRGESARLEEQLKRTREMLQQEEAAAGATDRKQLNWEQVQAQTEQEWIQIYLTSLERDRLRLTSKLQGIDESLKQVREAASKVAGDVVELKILQRQIDEKQEAVRLTLDRLSEINILSSNYSQTKVRKLDEAGVGYKIEPSLSKSLMMGILLGSMLGAGLALLIDRAEYIYRSPHEIFAQIGAPVLGRIPRVRLRGGSKKDSFANLITSHQTNSGFTESFRAARTSLFFATQAEEKKVLLCTSPSPGDGKSTTISNLALSMSQAGKRVLLIDADFRRPRLNQYLGLPMNPGVIDYLKGEVSLDGAMKQLEGESHLWIMTTGGRPTNPGELLANRAFGELIHAVRDKFDYILIDSPPVLPVADPCMIAEHVDGVLLVMRIRKGVKVTSQKAKESLDRVGAGIVGILVNGIDENPHYNEYGYYSYQYGGYGYAYGGSSRYYDKKYADYHDKLPSNG